VRKPLSVLAAALLSTSVLPAPGTGAATPPGELDPTERRIVAAVEAGVPDALELLEATVNVNSGTLNREGVRRVGEMFRAEFDRLGLETRWVDDFNPANNVGQNNLNVVAPQSPADFRFVLRNTTGKQARYAFETDAYVLGPPPACPDRIGPRDRGTFSERLKRTLQVHGRGRFPVPGGWTITITPPEPVLLPDQEIDVDVRIEPPPGFVGRQAFNVNARHEAGYAGGVTLVVAAS
jgi:hypothetical protein